MNNKKYKPKVRKISNSIEKTDGKKECLRTILLDDLDELYSIVIDLQIITYLNQVVQCDAESSDDIDILGFQKKENVEMFILEMQIEKMKKLDSLIKKISM